jgi:hypothetical protein
VFRVHLALARPGFFAAAAQNDSKENRANLFTFQLLTSISAFVPSIEQIVQSNVTPIR